MNKCYIASGWFTDLWFEELEDIKSVLNQLNLAYFSPKDENLCKPDDDANFQDQVFSGNIDGMLDCDWMICNSRNKDMGSIFEAGYFHRLDKPILYFCAGLPTGAKFNLMLARSGVKVCTSFEQLEDYLDRCLTEKQLIFEPYDQDIE